MDVLADSFYTSPEWRALRDRVLDRDGERCTVARLFGKPCSGTLHVHHIEKRTERPDLALDEDNCATVCQAHHPTWEALREALVKSRRPLKRCRHFHPYRSGREECDRRRARELGIILPAR